MARDIIITNPMDSVLDDVFGKLDASKRVLLATDLHIRTKEAVLVKFVPNLMQRKLLANMLGLEFTWEELDFSTFRGIRRIILKARQHGFTTLVALIYFILTITERLQYSVVLAHDKETTEKIFHIVKRAYENLPLDIKPKTGKNNVGELYFPELDSTFYVGTAGAKEFGRGTTVNNVLGSEAAFWENGEKLVAGLMEAVPLATGNIILESTANGVEGLFYDTYQEARYNAANLFKAYFCGWTENPEYALEVKEGDILDPVDAKEKIYFERHNLTPEQIKFYKFKKSILKDKMPQEYPATPDEAFISSGEGFFPTEVVMEYINNFNSKKVDIPLVEVPLELVDEEHTDGLQMCRAYDISIYRLCEPDKRYIASADAAEGSEGSDPSSIDVLCVDDMEQVVQINGPIPPEDLALCLEELYWYYNKAFIIPESNNHGHTVISTILRSTSIPKMSRTTWGGLYYHRAYDSTSRSHKNKPGFPTNSVTKPMMLDSLRSPLYDRAIIIHDRRSLDEILFYRKLGNGKYGAPNGKHDDRVISLALCTYLALNLPTMTKPNQASRVIHVPTRGLM